MNAIYYTSIYLTILSIGIFGVSDRARHARRVQRQSIGRLGLCPPVCCQAGNTPCGKKKIKEALSVARDGNVPVDYSYLGAHRRPGHGAGQPGTPVPLVAVAWLSDGPGGHLRGPGTLNDEIAVKYDEKGCCCYRHTSPASVRSRYNPACLRNCWSAANRSAA